MIRELIFKHGGIVSGETKRDIEEIFPNVSDKFRQRKKYDEYYFSSCDVALELNDLELLNEKGYSFELCLNYITVNE